MKAWKLGMVELVSGEGIGLGNRIWIWVWDVRDVVGSDFEFEIGFGVVCAAVEEGFHDFVLVDWIVGLVGRVVED